MFPFGTVNSNPLYTDSPPFEIFTLFDMLIISMGFALLFSLTTTSENRCSVYTYSSTFWPHIICSAFILRSCYISVYRWISFKLESHCTSWAFWIGRTKYKSNWLCIHPRNRYRNKTHSVLRYSNRKTCICIISIFCSKLFWKIYDGKLLAILLTHFIYFYSTVTR